MKPNPESQSAIDHRLHDMNRRYEMLEQHPEAQAEIVADHYASLAMTATVLRRLTQQRRYCGTNPELEQCIEFHVKALTEAHAQAFGIELAWPAREEVR